MHSRLLPCLLALVAFSACAQDLEDTPIVADAACLSGYSNIIDFPLAFRWLNGNCIRIRGGFSSVAGSFVGLSYSKRNLLHLGEILSLDAEYGMRRRRARFGLNKASVFGKPIELGATVFGERFNYDQGRESSIFAFQRNIPEFTQFNPENALNYVSHQYGVSAFGRYRLGAHSRFGLEYDYSVADIQTQTDATGEYFSYIFPFNQLNDVRTSKLIPSYSYNTVDGPANPTRGMALSISTAMAGLGGDVSTVEPTVDMKYFHPGFGKGHVIAFHLFGRLLSGYGGSAAPPFDRLYIGGENDIRGFDSWSVSPIAYIPGVASVDLLNTDGTPRTQKGVNVTMSVPVCRPVSVGGDTSIVTNIEYRIPILGPLTLALFTDAGVNRVTFQDQLEVNPLQILILNEEFPQAGFSRHVSVVPGTQKIRVSSGAELQVRVPKIHVPLRFYFAANPSRYRDVLQSPTIAERGYFPNAATYENALSIIDAATPLRERVYMVRFAIGRTF